MACCRHGNLYKGALHYFVNCLNNKNLKAPQNWPGVPHDTLNILIWRSQYNTFLDTHPSSVRCWMNIVSRMKAEEPVIRSTSHNLLLQQTWHCRVISDYFHHFAELYQTISITLQSYIRLFPSISSEKRICFDLYFSKILVHIVSGESWYTRSAVLIGIVGIRVTKQDSPHKGPVTQNTHRISSSWAAITPDIGPHFTGKQTLGVTGHLCGE